MSRIEQSIDVDVPVREAYNQWTQFEEFPRFMEGVEAVHQLDDTRLHWVATVAGKRQEWDAKITEQTPDQRIAWTSTSGDHNAGSVDFHRISDSRTQVTLTMEVEPSGAVEKIGDAIGVTDATVKGDLERFKKFIESRGSATGAWRGEVEGGQVTSRGSSTGSRELAGAGTMGMTGTGSDLGGSDYGTGTTGGATPEDPYGMGTTGSGYETGTGTGTGRTGTGGMGSGVNDPMDMGTGRREDERDL